MHCFSALQSLGHAQISEILDSPLKTIWPLEIPAHTSEVGQHGWEIPY